MCCVPLCNAPLECEQLQRLLHLQLGIKRRHVLSCWQTANTTSAAGGESFQPIICSQTFPAGSFGTFLAAFVNLLILCNKSCFQFLKVLGFFSAVPTNLCNRIVVCMCINSVG